MWVCRARPVSKLAARICGPRGSVASASASARASQFYLAALMGRTAFTGTFVPPTQPDNSVQPKGTSHVQ